MDTISIVIPVYNSADTLAACMDSVLAQTYRDLEILLVDDGSTDGSLEIGLRYAAGDPRVRVIRGNHSGPGAARNLGIRGARGKYLLFVDSDDLCEPELAERLYTEAARKRTGLVLCGMMVTDDTGKVINVFREWGRRCYTRAYATATLTKWKTNPFCGGVYCKLFDTQILRENGILFEEHSTYAEDFCFNLTYLCHIENVAILPDLLYRYCMGRPGSLTEKNLLEGNFADLWRRRMEVAEKFEEVYDSFDLKDTCPGAVPAFYWTQAADMIALSARREENCSAFSADMAVLRNTAPKKNEQTGVARPEGVPVKDVLALRLMLAGWDRALWMYERGRRRLRLVRSRERGGGT